MKTGGFFIRSLAKAVRNRQKWTNEKMKTSVLDGPSYQIHKFSRLQFCYDSKNLAEITHFNTNTGFTFPKLGRNAEKTRLRAMFTKFLKGRRFIVKNF